MMFLLVARAWTPPLGLAGEGSSAESPGSPPAPSTASVGRFQRLQLALCFLPSLLLCFSDTSRCYQPLPTELVRMHDNKYHSFHRLYFISLCISNEGICFVLPHFSSWQQNWEREQEDVGRSFLSGFYLSFSSTCRRKMSHYTFF